MRAGIIVCVAFLALSLVIVVYGAPCTQNDYEAEYTQCRPDGTRDLVYFKKRGSTCVGGDPPLDPTFDLLCNISCSVGSYLPKGKTACAQCAAGTFSHGGGRIIDHWDTFPLDVGVWTTYCKDDASPYPVVGDPSCGGWTANTTHIRSGNITYGRSSILELKMDLLAPGHVSFMYRVNAQPNADLLFFFIGHDNMLTALSTPDQAYKTFTANLTVGDNTLRWEFRQTVPGEARYAYIDMLELSGIDYAVDECTPCQPGHHASGLGNTICKECGLNTAAAGFGNGECSACAADEFALPGSAACEPRPPCTEEDYVVLNSVCDNNNRMTQRAEWLQPMLCDNSTGTPLPSIKRDVDCGPCDQGKAPTRAGGPCAYCGQGKFSPGGSTPCGNCGKGEAAVRMLTFEDWHQWDSTHFATACEGDCNGGWRLHGDYIESGLAHGEQVVSNLTLDVFFEYPGVIIFEVGFFCNDYCDLVFSDYPYRPAETFRSMDFPYGQRYGWSRPNPQIPQFVEEGWHTFTWTFVQNIFTDTPNVTLANDEVRIYNIRLVGTGDGGAASCTSCKDGQYAEEDSMCFDCPAGTTPNADRDGCDMCGGNMYNSVAAGACIECGAGTFANGDHTDCDNPCTKYIDGHEYDFQYINNVNWPVSLENNGWLYELNVCNRILDSRCQNPDGSSLNAYACQSDGSHGKSIGYRATFESSSDPSTVVATFDLGEKGDCPEERKATVNLVCNDNAWGGLEPLQSWNGVETSACVYSFRYESIYACAKCDSTHYDSYFTPCLNGQQQKIYYWNNPKLCSNGVSLPQSEIQNCQENEVPCVAGEQLSADGQGCQPCESGEFSVGGGLAIQEWPTEQGALFPYNFWSICLTDPCEPWDSHDGYSLMSGQGDTALLTRQTFRTDGFVMFDWKFYSPSPEQGIFHFFIDDQKILDLTSNVYMWTPMRLPVSAGVRTLRWEFHGGEHGSPSLMSLRGVAVANIVLTGLQYHDSSCYACPAGYRAPYSFELAQNKFTCQICPTNTYSDAPGAADCTSVDTGYYAFAGATEQTWMPSCTPSDFVWYYSSCTDGTRNAYASQLYPQTCQGNFPESQTVPCATCPEGTIEQDGECKGCTQGKYFRNGQCVDNPAGSVVERRVKYFDGNNQAWPLGFSSICSGTCGSDGWRFSSNGGIDSGAHGKNFIDSWWTYEFTLVVDGYISFEYTVSSLISDDSGVMLILDKYQYPLPAVNVPDEYMNVSIPLKAGDHYISMNYHQINAEGYSAIQNFVVSGVDIIDGYSSSAPCDKGYFSNDPTASACEICPAGQFSANPGSTSCGDCAVGSYSLTAGSEGCTTCENGSYTNSTRSTVCQTTCEFTVKGNNYKLPYSATVSTYDGSHQQYLINVCGFTNECENSHVCMKDNAGNLHPFGSTFEFSPVMPTNVSEAVTFFSVNFAKGSATAACPNGTSSIISFQCDPTSSAASPNFLNSDGCHSIFFWPTISACPVCRTTDYHYVEGVCTDGKREISETRTRSCNGPLTIDHPSKKCSAHEFPTGAVVAVVVVFVVVALSAVGVIVRNRYLTRQYGKLLNESRSHQDNSEMKNVHSNSAVL